MCRTGWGEGVGLANSESANETVGFFSTLGWGSVGLLPGVPVSDGLLCCELEVVENDRLFDDPPPCTWSREGGSGAATEGEDVAWPVAGSGCLGSGRPEESSPICDDLMASGQSPRCSRFWTKIVPAPKVAQIPSVPSWSQTSQM